MNSRIKITAFIIAWLIGFAAIAQETNGFSYKYRVTAHKKGNDQIFSQSNVADITPPLAIYIPNSFTPNNDGLNDTFGAKAEGITDYSIQIYNRWGILVFESTRVDEYWDGKINGIVSDIGVYTYLIFAKSENHRVKKSGTITLIL